jgi:hypothetical protein
VVEAWRNTTGALALMESEEKQQNNRRTGRKTIKREEKMREERSSSLEKPQVAVENLIKEVEISLLERRRSSLSLKKERNLSSCLKISLLEKSLSSSLEFPFDPFAVYSMTQ